MSLLRKKAVAGVLWSTGLNVFRDFLQFGIMLILVRLLSPEDYGKFSLVTSIMGFLSVFSFRVFLEHTLQIRPGSEVDYQIHFTAGVILQSALFLCTNLAAELMKHLGQYAQVAPAVHVMSILFLLDLGNEFRARMLEREMNWQRLRVLQGTGIVVSAVVSLAMAAAGAGVYALLIPALLFGIPTTIDLVFIQRWRPTWKWSAAAYRPAWDYGLTRFMSALVIWTRQLLESTFLVKIAGFALYGIYGRVLGLSAICCLKVPSLLTQALFPVLTKLNPGSESSGKVSSLVFCAVAWPTFPIAVVFSVLASPVILTLYGPRWSEAIAFLPWAMAAGAATALAQTGDLLLVTNLQQKKSLRIDAITLAGTAAALAILAPRSLKLYLMGMACLQVAAFIVMLVWLYRARAMDLQSIAGALISPMLSAGVSFLAMELVQPFLEIPRETVAGAVCYGALFCLLYTLLLRLASGPQCREMVRFLPGSSYLQRWLVLGT